MFAVPAHIVDRGENATAVAGGSAVLRCNAKGDAHLRVSWSSHHRVLRPEEIQTRVERNKNLVVAELHLNSVSRSDAGRFRCSAANDFGHDEMVVHLSVQGILDIDIQINLYPMSEPHCTPIMT